MREIPSSTDIVVVSGDFENWTPEELFDAWTDPAILTTWWPEVAQVEAGVGGKYRLEWPSMDWVMEGQFLTFERGHHLGFTWSWNHEPEKATRNVNIHFLPVDGGSRMAIYQGTYGIDVVSQDDRRGVLEGYIHFGMKLAALKRGESS